LISLPSFLASASASQVAGITEVYHCALNFLYKYIK
jgi:hypothetical protein